MIFTEIDGLKSRLDSLRPLPVNTVRTLHEQQVLEWTYHSNAIEGNTLTLKETKVVLEDITIGGKPLREHFETSSTTKKRLITSKTLCKNVNP